MYYVYMLTNQSNKVLYTGVPNNLEHRLYEHSNKVFKGFTAKYNAKKLVYFSIHQMYALQLKEKNRLRAGRAARKISLLKVSIPSGRTCLANGLNDKCTQV